MHKLEFTLRQHTPLIHFQHHQDGATLRATELKPKLDRFILERLNSSQKQLSWVKVLPNNGVSLDYKLFIWVEDEPEKFLISSFIRKKDKEILNGKHIKTLAPSSYFAQEKEIKDYVKNPNLEFSKLGIMHKKNLSVEIRSFHDDLIQIIDASLEDFFVHENFGTRQSKGFGSFTRDVTTESSFEDSLLKHPHFQKGFRRKQLATNLSDILKIIQSEYSILKSGNQNTDSQIQIFFKDFEKEEGGHSIDWEKKKAKDHLVFKKGDEKIQDLRNNQNYQYVRALLGLAEEYTYPHNENQKVKIKAIEKDIERFKSPILFKVFGNRIYILPNCIDLTIFDTQFDFSNENRVLKLKTPPKKINETEVFDLAAFLDYGLDNKWETLKK